MANLPATTLLDFVIGDFRAAWGALAADQVATHRGNFMFAFQSMVLLEVICRSCDDPTLDRFALALKRRDRRYFTKLPGRPPSPSGFKLPESGTDPEKRLLHALFDIIRNGQAHQYQPTLVTLADGQHLHVRLTGAAYGTALSKLDVHALREREHLRATRDREGHVWIDVRTDLLFLDLVDATSDLGLPTRQFNSLSANDAGYRYDADALLRALREGGHSVDAATEDRLVPTMVPQVYADALKSSKF